ncbi:hypothetical protein VitviT2T_026345 [Vitis vinifera]|uniref:RING-type E3 ubiquitin transferase n=1 Tax=Vitis vinifera TaxID=29760 RepID=A0ABY9DPU8_VITVI|nr:RING-H2 finger protein ATL56-like [Vitis vinifera]WKA08640.1 hypothetical protein VitviT2T_026345 [Vitis vinifera]|eukprot:XP_003634293.2 PREDICTED: RING-H2 finger protein ATL56-like [Vitis vinifera]
MVMEIVVSLVLLFVGIAVLIVIHVCIVGRAFRRAYGNGAMVQRGGSGGLGMSQDELKKLPCFEYKAVALEKASNSPVDCAVCLENFRKGDKCRLLPNCKHFFHSQCIDSWLLKTPICPICRTCASTPKISTFSGQESGISRDVGAELT